MVFFIIHKFESFYETENICTFLLELNKLFNNNIPIKNIKVKSFNDKYDIYYPYENWKKLLD